jgi:hypothetical protein
MGHHHLNFGAETFFVELESFFAVTVEVEVWIDVHDEYLLSGRIGGTESNENAFPVLLQYSRFLLRCQRADS